MLDTKENEAAQRQATGSADVATGHDPAFGVGREEVLSEMQVHEQTPVATLGSAGDEDTAQQTLSESEMEEATLEGSAQGGHATENSIAAAVFLLAPSGTILEAYSSCTTLLGWEHSELVGKNMAELLESGADNVRERLAEDFEVDAGFDTEFRRRTRVIARKKNGSTIAAEATVRRPKNTDFCMVILQTLPASPAAPALSGARLHTGAAPNPPAPSIQESQKGLPDSEERPQPSLASSDGPVTEREPIAPPENGREALLARIFTTETELHLVRRRLEQEARRSKDLEEKSQALASAKTELEKGLAEQEQKQQDLVNVETRLRSDQEALAQALRQARDAEERLARNTADLEEAKAALTKQAEEHQHLQSESSSQLQAVKAGAEQAQAICQEKAARCAQLEEDLEREARQRKELEEKIQALAAAKAELEKRSAEPRSAEQGGALPAELSQLEAKLRHSVASQACLTADLEKERGSRQRSEQRASFLAAQLQSLHEELKAQFTSQQADQKRVAELEEELRQREQALAQANSELQKQSAALQLAQQQAEALGELSSRLEANLLTLEEAHTTFKHTEEQMESRLQASLKALEASESKLQQETSERRRLEQALASTQRQVENSQLELSRLRAAQQAEGLDRKLLEGGALRSRYAALDSLRKSQELLGNLRQKMQPPMEDLQQSARRLLQAELPEEQKQVAEAILENVFLLQASLQEPVDSSSGAGEPERRAQESP